MSGRIRFSIITRGRWLSPATQIHFELYTAMRIHGESSAIDSSGIRRFNLSRPAKVYASQ